MGMRFEEISCSRWKSEGNVKSVGWPCSPPCHVFCHVTSVLTFDDDRQMNYYPQPCLHVLWVRCYSHFGDKAPCIQSFALVSSFAVMAQVLGICKGRTVAELSLVHILSAESPSKSTHALQMRSYSIHAWRL